MNTIWKFILQRHGISVIKIPDGAWKILAVQVQELDPVVWVEVSTGAALSQEIEITAIITGGNPPQGSTYIGTVQIHHGAYVIHYYRTV
jgi:hypothetical protein